MKKLFVLLSALALLLGACATQRTPEPVSRSIDLQSRDLAQPKDITFSWAPVTKTVENGSASGILTHYRLYICDSPITFGTDAECEGKLLVVNTPVVDNDGFIVGQDKPWLGDFVTVHVEAENFDAGSEGTTWHDTDSGNNYDAHHPPYRADKIDVDVRCSPWDACKAGGNAVKGYQIGNGATGEWQQFTVDISEAGEYTPTVRVTNGRSTDATLTFSVNNQSQSFTIVGTGGWDTHKELTGKSIQLTKGKQVFRTTNTVGPLDLDWWELKGRTVAPDASKPSVLFTVSYALGTVHARVVAVNKDGKESELSNAVFQVLEEEPVPVDVAPKPPVLRFRN
jgi:hypothetical protein